jgi:hypothetical protein
LSTITKSETQSGRFRISARLVQQILGVLWLLDGALQFQPFMFGKGFLTQIIEPVAQGQPDIVGQPIMTMAHLLQSFIVPANAGFATIQVLIGLGLLASRRTVKPALTVSFAWSLIVWLFGEGLGMLPMGMASPLTGAPGAVILYALIGLMVWPGRSATKGSAASEGLLGDTGGRVIWAGLWVLLGALMLQPANRDAGATSTALSTAAGAAPTPFAALDGALGHATSGLGLDIAVIASLFLALIGLGVFVDRLRNLSLLAGALFALLVWITAENFGGMFTGSGTDPNSGPLLALMALALFCRPPVLRSHQASSATGGRPESGLAAH